MIDCLLLLLIGTSTYIMFNYPTLECTVTFEKCVLNTISMEFFLRVNSLLGRNVDWKCDEFTITFICNNKEEQIMIANDILFLNKTLTNNEISTINYKKN